MPLCVQGVNTFRGYLLMVFCSTIILRKLQQDPLHSDYSRDDFLYIMHNQKATVFEDVIIPTECSKKQNDLYKPTHINPELTIVC